MFEAGLVFRGPCCVLVLGDPSQFISRSQTPTRHPDWFLPSDSLLQIVQPLLLDLPSKHTPHALLPTCVVVTLVQAALS